MASSRDSQVIGIDVGTSSIRVAASIRGRIQYITFASEEADQNELQLFQLPAFVGFFATGRHIGVSTKASTDTEPENTIFNIKPILRGHYASDTSSHHLPFTVSEYLDQTAIPVRYRNEKRFISPTEALSMVLTKAKYRAEVQLGHAVSRAVVSIPVVFNVLQRKAVEDAACIAGLDVISFIHGPTAIALYHNNDREVSLESTNVLVYDLGSGFFNAGVFEMRGNKVIAKGLTGSQGGGGNDIDSLMAGLCAARFEKEYRKDPRSDKISFHRLRMECETAKKHLSTNNDVRVRLPRLISGLTLDIRLTKDYFIKRTRKIVLASLAKVDAMLEELGVTKSQLHELVITGDSMRMLGLRELVSNYLSDIPLHYAMYGGKAEVGGAATVAECITVNIPIEDRYVDILSQPIGISIQSATRIRRIQILERGTPIPSTGKAYVTTWRSWQRMLDINVLEWDDPNHYAKHRILKSLKFREIELAPMGVPQLLVTIKVDQKMAISVSMNSAGNGKSQNHALHEVGGIPAEEMARAIARAEKYWYDELTSRPSPTPSKSASRVPPIYTPNFTSSVSIKDIMNPVPQSPNIRDVSKVLGSLGTWFESRLGIDVGVSDQTTMHQPQRIAYENQPVRRATSLPVQKSQLGVVSPAKTNASAQLRRETAPSLSIQPISQLRFLDEQPWIHEPDTISMRSGAETLQSGGSASSSTPRSSRSGVESLFPKDEQLQPKQMYTDAEFVQIGTFLRNNRQPKWAEVPRLYTVLRLIGELELLDQMIDSGITDIWFPFRADSLPVVMKPSAKASFLNIQGAVLSKALGLEKSTDKKHTHFADQEPLPFQVVGALGSGAYGEVDKVMSNLSHREFARKRFRKPRALKKEDVKTFLNELQILKRISHIHTVDLVRWFYQCKKNDLELTKWRLYALDRQLL